MIELLAGILWGLLVHQTERVTKRIPDGWQSMTNYGIGWIAVFPFFDFVFRRIPNMVSQPREKARIAFILSGVFFGVGVGLGKLIDALLGDKR